MKTISKNAKIALSSIAAIIALSFNAYAVAQEEKQNNATEIDISALVSEPQVKRAISLEKQVVPLEPDVKLGSCPNPISISLNKNSAAAPVITNFPLIYQAGLASSPSVYNQTIMDKWFGDTLVFKKASNHCCQYSMGKLVVRYKALATSKIGQSSTNNDGSFVFAKNSSGTVYPIYSVESPTTGHIWGNNVQGNTTAGQVTVRTFIIPPHVMASGNVNLFAQDDTAVLSVQLTGGGCCLNPNIAAQ